MAQSKNFFNDVKEELECCVCQEQFSDINEPKILKCLHTFCKTCLEKLLRQHGGAAITCPMCRQITECPNNNTSVLASNLFYKRMVEIVEAYSGQGDEGTPPCGSCEENKPLKFHCFDCNCFLCDDCAEAHKKLKVFTGHHVKEIGKFKSNDYEDFARKANVCKQHKEELKFYCGQCDICICRDCAILEHRDHKFVSFEEGLEEKKSEIGTKLKEVEVNGSRLKNRQQLLKERRVKVNKSIEQATDEVHRVAEHRINLIRLHEARVTARLVERKSEVDDFFSNQLSSVTARLMEIDSSLKFTEEVFGRNNLPEILNLEGTLKQRLQDLSMPLGESPAANLSEVKYVPYNVFTSSDTFGNLVTTITEPSLSVAEGAGLKECLEGEESCFTVTTKDWEGQTTYSENDKIVVEIKSKKTKYIKPNVTDLKNGRYTVSYRPEAAGEFEVSIKLGSEHIKGSSFHLKVRQRSKDLPRKKADEAHSGASKLQTENFKDCVTKADPPSDVGIRKYRLETTIVVQSIQQKEQKYEGATLAVKPYDAVLKKDEDVEVFERVSAKFRVETLKGKFSREEIKSILEEIKNETGAEGHESSDEFILSGSFTQIKEARSYLQQRVNPLAKSLNGPVSNGLDKEIPSGYEETGSFSSEHNEPELGRRRSRSSGLKRATQTDTPDEHPLETSVRSVSPTPQYYETTPKFMAFLDKAYKDDLNEMEEKYKVTITPKKDEENKIYVVPGEACTAKEHDNACDTFITLYQRVHQNMKLERFSLKSEKNRLDSRKQISEIRKKYAVLVEIGSDQKHWELYGEKDVVEAALKDLEEKVGIKREDTGSESSQAEKRKPRGSRDHEVAMGVDPLSSAVVMTNRLETTVGKVKLSVCKGDITNERVDVIVNAANARLDHIGGVAQAISDRGGWSIQDESNKIARKMGRRLKDGEAVSTGAGNLPCKMVVHAVGPIWNKVGSSTSRNILRRACLSSFHVTQDHEMTSVALPAIGSGIYGMPKDVCAEVMFEAVEEFVRVGDPKAKTITDIRFVNIDDPTVEAFKQEFMTRYATNQDDRPAGRNKRWREEEEREAEGNEKPKENPPREERGRVKNPLTSGDKGSGQHDTHTRNSGSAIVSYVGQEQSSSSTRSYSDALKENDGSSGKKNVKDKRLFSSKEDVGKDKSKDSASRGASSKPECPICLDALTQPQTLKCGHAFCSECIGKALEVNNMCPVCKAPQGVVTGTQPPGQMNVRCDRYMNVPGFKGSGTIVIDYYFPPGTQGPEHPNPGQRYEGTRRTGYLPNTTEGNEVLHLLKRAFDARLVFTIGTSITTGRSNQVTWNDIHHKTNVYGGPQQFGYPDPDYLRRVKEDLAAKGIR